jgi:hypothetical protein
MNSGYSEVQKTMIWYVTKINRSIFRTASKPKHYKSDLIKMATVSGLEKYFSSYLRATWKKFGMDRQELERMICNYYNTCARMTSVLYPQYPQRKIPELEDLFEHAVKSAARTLYNIPNLNYGESMVGDTIGVVVKRSFEKTFSKIMPLQMYSVF